MTIEHPRPRERVGGMPPMDFAASIGRALRLRTGVVPQLSRYSLVSAVALGVDFAVFLILNAGIGLPMLSGVAGYACGIVVHYQLSRRFVFDAARSSKSAQRMFSEFVASGLVGLAVTAGVIALATLGFGLQPLVAKILAVGASFVGVFIIRRTFVFA
jgi:putative flippase GtrA